MKKLERLMLLNDLPKLGIEDQKFILGGSGDGIPQDPTPPDSYTFICVNGVWGYSPCGFDGVTIYGSAPGYLGDIKSLESLAADYGDPNLADTFASILIGAASYFVEGYRAVTLTLTGLGLGESISSYSDATWAARLDEVIFQITNRVGYDSSTQLRYSLDNNMVKVWNAETGELLGESSY